MEFVDIPQTRITLHLAAPPSPTTVDAMRDSA
jgi:hypothetical protein